MPEASQQPGFPETSTGFREMCVGGVKMSVGARSVVVALLKHCIIARVPSDQWRKVP